MLPSFFLLCRVSHSLNQTLYASVFALTVLVFPLQLSASGNRQNQPNIVLIVADDMGYSDLSSFGSEIQTPHIDSLAARGARFTNFYAETVCCPSRASLLTGLHPHQAGVGWFVSHGADTRPPGPYQGYLNRNSVTLAEVLKTAGYQTAMSGKWHVGESRPNWPVDRGFDQSFGLISGSANYFDITKDYQPEVRRQMMINDRPYTPPKDDFYLTTAISDYAVRQMEEMQRQESPFFLYVAFTAPHLPLQAPKEDIERALGRYDEGWQLIRERRFARMKEMGLVADIAALPPTDPEMMAWEAVQEPDIEALKMSIYAAQMEQMDKGVGQILQKLREMGVEQNTLVIFLSDNGACTADTSRFRSRDLNRPPHLGGPDSYQGYGVHWANVSSTPLRKFKTSLHEGGIATPLIAAGPGVSLPAGSISHVPGHVMDIMPTLIQISGATYPRSLNGKDITPFEGTSLIPAWGGKEMRRDKPFFWEFEGKRAMRDGNWKLLGGEGEAWELYDLSRDRGERENLASKYRERVEVMGAKYTDWMNRCGILQWKDVSGELINIPGLK